MSSVVFSRGVSRAAIRATLRRRGTSPSLWASVSPHSHPRPSTCLLQQTRPKSSKAASKSSSKDKPTLHFLKPADTPVTHVMSKRGGELVPGGAGQHPDGPVAQATLQKMDTRMKGAVEWFRGQVQGMEMRGTGRVVPSVLDPIRVPMDDGSNVKVEEIATVGVREGSTLVVTVFDETMMSRVQKALQSDRLGLVPQRHDDRTIRIPIPRPTAETRLDLIKSAQKLAEEARVKVRLAANAAKKSLKEAKLGKGTVALDDVQKVEHGYVAEVDEEVEKMKKVMV